MSKQPKDWRPVTVAEVLRKGIAEMLRIEVLGFLSQSKPDGLPGY